MNRFDKARTLLSAALLLWAIFASVLAHSQLTTEQFIPIGQSPGISDKHSAIGSIVAVDRAAHTIEVQSNRGRKTFSITPATRIWLDRSKILQSNQLGTYNDCEVGRRIEVMRARDDEAVADWIKIESG